MSTIHQKEKKIEGGGEREGEKEKNSLVTPDFSIYKLKN